jgi:hypothetical protein
MVKRDMGDSGNGRSRSLAVGWLRAEALIWIGVFPAVGMALECCTPWRLNAIWVSLYLGLVGAALAATGMVKYMGKQ